MKDFTDFTHFRSRQVQKNNQEVESMQAVQLVNQLIQRMIQQCSIRFNNLAVGVQR